MSDEMQIMKGFCYAKRGGFTPVDIDDWSEQVRKNSVFQWIELDGSSDTTRSWLTETLKLKSVVVNALLAEETRPRIQKVSARSFIMILREISNNRQDPTDMASLRLYVTKRYVVAIRFRKTNALTKLAKLNSDKRGANSVGSFLMFLLSQMVHSSHNFLLHELTRLDVMEEQVLQSPTDELRDEVTVLRRNNVVLSRYLKPQTAVFGSLVQFFIDWFEVEEQPTLVDLKNSADKVNEDLDAIRERAVVIQDEIRNYLAEKQAKNTYALTILAGIFLPLSFLTGLLGVNLAGIPFAENSLAFLGFSVILVLFFMLIILFFKINDWL